MNVKRKMKRAARARSPAERAEAMRIEKTQSSRIVLVVRSPGFAARARALSLLCVLAIAAAGCGRRNTARAPRTSSPPIPAVVGEIESGIASWYGEPYHGRRAASGEIYDMEQLTAAHRTLPFETWVEVTNLNNEKTVDVRITDRGPFIEGRIIDLSLAAARELDMVRAGIVPVRLRVIDPPIERAGRRDATAAEPSSEPPSQTGYAVQAGAFSDQSRAAAFRDSLPFADARVIPRAGEPPLWRVLVGRALNMDAAAALAQQVREAAGEACVVEDR